MDKPGLGKTRKWINQDKDKPGLGQTKDMDKPGHG